MQGFMNKELPKTYTCPCGRTKKVKWFDKHDFKNGLIPMTFGYSRCPRKTCDIFQVHFAGDPFAIEAFVNSEEFEDLERHLYRQCH